MMDNINRSLWDSSEFDSLRTMAYDELDAACNLAGLGDLAALGEERIQNQEELGSVKNPQTVCRLAESSAKALLFGYLRGAGTGASKDWGLLRLGVEFRETTGRLDPSVQDAIWRLSAYQDLDDLSSVHSVDGKTDEQKAVQKQKAAQKAVGAIIDANKVRKYVENRPGVPKLNGR